MCLNYKAEAKDGDYNDNDFFLLLYSWMLSGQISCYHLCSKPLSHAPPGGRAVY